MSWKDISGGSGMADLVTSVFGRIGDVVADPGDYTLLDDLTMLSETGAAKSAAILSNGVLFSSGQNQTRLTFKNPKNITGDLFEGFEIVSQKANVNSDNTSSTVTMSTSLDGTDFADNEFLAVNSDLDINFNINQVTIKRTDGYLGIGRVNPLAHLHIAHSNFPRQIFEETTGNFEEKMWELRAQNDRFEMAPLFDNGNSGPAYFRAERIEANVTEVKWATNTVSLLSSIDFTSDATVNLYCAKGSFGVNRLKGVGGPLVDLIDYDVTIAHNTDTQNKRAGIGFGIGVVAGTVSVGAGIYSNHTGVSPSVAQNLEFYVNNDAAASALGLTVMPDTGLRIQLPETLPSSANVGASQGIFHLYNAAGPAQLQLQMRNSGSTLNNINLSREQINTLNFDESTDQSGTFPLRAACYIFTNAALAATFFLPTLAAHRAAHGDAPIHVIRNDSKSLIVEPVPGETINGFGSLPMIASQHSQAVFVPESGSLVNWVLLSHAAIA